MIMEQAAPAFNKFIFFTYAGFITTVLLLVAYFSKKRKKNELTKHFVYMMFFSLFCDILEVLYLNALPALGVSEFVLTLVAKAYLLLLVAFIGFIPLYTSLIYFRASNENVFSKLEKYILKISIFLAALICSLHSVTFEYNIAGNSVLYIGGKAPEIVFYFCMFFVFSGVYCTFRYFRKVKYKVVLPIIFYLFISSTVGMLYYFDHMFIFLGFAQSLIIFVMYLTVQNPDMDLVADLNIAKENVDKANAAKSNFLSSMSHEIRTPLNAIVGLSEDIVNQEDLPAEVQDDAKDIVVASKTLLDIINNIMGINKIENGKMEVFPVPYNVADVINSIIDDLQHSVKEGVTLSASFADDIPYTLVGDKNHLHTIIHNLVSNSVKFTSKGHITVNVKCFNNFINDESTLMVSVEDTGEGIRTEDLERLFTKYQKADIRRENTISGAGLGLAITKNLVELMGGKISVQSQFGIGSIFVVQLPQKIQTEASIEESNEVTKQANIESSEPVDYSNKRILVVDDNKLNLKVARRTLESLNAMIDECTSGQECINLIRSGKVYDVILMDMMMPNLSGADTMVLLSKTENFNMPVIVLTADDSVDAKEKYLAQGFVDYVSKPFSKEQIQSKLDKIFRNDGKEQ